MTLRSALMYLLLTLTLMLSGSVMAANDNAKQQLRIVALAPHIVELLYEIGAGQQIIATTTFADYPEQAKAIPVVGNYARLQIERILQLQPDLIIAWRSGNPADDLARLSDYGLNIVYSNPQTLEDVASELTMLGELTGREKAAKAVATQFMQTLQNLQQQFADREPISVFYELWPQPLRTIAGTAWPQQHLSVCGAENPFLDASGDYPQVSIESVLASAPQVIIQPQSAGQDDTAFTQWDQWHTIPAVTHGQILHPNADKLHRMSSQVLDEITSLCLQLDAARQAYRQQEPTP